MKRTQGTRSPGKMITQATSLLAVLGVVLVLSHPDSAILIGYALVTMWATGPVAPVIPGGYEAITMVMGRLHPPWLVASIGTVANLYVELLKYYLYGVAVRNRRARVIRDSRVIGWLRRVFEQRPFFAVWLCSWSPIPYWFVSVLAPLTGYPVRRFLAATLLGRFPRFLFVAALGTWWHVDARLLLGFAGATLVAGVILWILRPRKPILDPMKPPTGLTRGNARSARGSGAAQVAQTAGADAWRPL